MPQIVVRVSEDLTIDAGSWETVGSGDHTRRVVHPPERTMFEQLLDYLERRPQVAGYPGINAQHEALVATALCLRWGSYFAVLADADKPSMALGSMEDSYGCIADAEMKRINIESSAALEQWIDILRSDYQRYLRLMWVAHRDVPLSHKNTGKDSSDHLTGRAIQGLAYPRVANMMTLSQPEDWYDARVGEAREHPTRVLANALINACWRNGPIEDVHASPAPLGYPLTKCRVAKREGQRVLLSVATRMKYAIMAVTHLAQHSDDEREWWERVLPYNTANPFLLVTPEGWSLDQKTCEVVLPGAEP